MNMKININRKLAELCFFILMICCPGIEAYKERKYIHQETIESQQRLMDKIIDKNPSNLRKDTNEFTIPVAVVNNTVENKDDAGNAAVENNLGDYNRKANDDQDVDVENKDIEPVDNKNKTKLTFWSGFVDSLSMIFLVEFGDRTFMITVLFTMKHDKWKVFIPAIFTMMSMHLISVGFGTLFPLLFSQNTIVYFSVLLFLFFGIMMIYEAYHMQPKSAEEKVQELQDELLNKEGTEGQVEAVVVNGAHATESEKKVVVQPDNKLSIEKAKEEAKQFCSNPYLHLVVLLFLADWGDRCQISAIVLTATHNVWGVAAGGALGMAICVFLAVLSGAFLANRLNEKTTTYIAGVLFIVFAFQSLFMIE